MRTAWFYIALMLVGACDSTDPVQDTGEGIRFDLSLQLSATALPGEIPLSGTCDLFFYGIPREADRVVLYLDGIEIATSPESTIRTIPTVQEVGRHEVTVKCFHRDVADSVTAAFEVVQPARVTLRLRNFTQEGEPFVRDEGPISFRLAEEVLMSPDSAVFEVLPGAEYEILAEHPDFHHLWARLVDGQSGAFLDLYNVRNKHASVRIDADREIDIYLIRVSDITSIPNEPERWRMSDSEPFYSISSLREALFKLPLSSGMGPIIDDKITIWTGRSEGSPSSDYDDIVSQLFLVDGPDHVSTLTSGRITSVEFADSAERPDPVNAGFILQVVHAYPYGTWVNDHLTDDGALEEVAIYVRSGVNRSDMMTLFLHAIGLRGSVGYDASDDFVDGNSPSRFARLALKILYASTPNARL